MQDAELAAFQRVAKRTAAIHANVSEQRAGRLPSDLFPVCFWVQLAKHIASGANESKEPMPQAVTAAIAASQQAAAAGGYRPKQVRLEANLVPCGGSL